MNLKQPDSTLFSENEFQWLREHFQVLTGNKLGPDKRILFESRLRKRLNELAITSKDYLTLIKKDSDELSEFISALTTHKTDWFREPQHFTFLNDYLLERQNQEAKGPLAIWSAASSTGEEGYSIAFNLLEKNVHQFQILGSDISRECVEKAQKGIYLKTVVDQQVRSEIKKKYFLSGNGPNNDRFYKVNPDIQKQMKWREFNLMESQLPPNITFDIIFLRNVLIYFDQPNLVHIISRLTSYLKPGGYLILGLSETIQRPEELGLARHQNSVYKKLK